MYYLVLGGFYLNEDKEFKVCLKRISDGADISIRLYTEEKNFETYGMYEETEENVSVNITHIPNETIWPYIQLPTMSPYSFNNVLLEDLVDKVRDILNTND
jgi:hypothetical protein